MKTYIGVIITIILFTFAIDTLLSFQLRHFTSLWKNKTSRIIYWCIPILLLSLFFIFAVIINSSFVNEKWYWNFTLFNGIYLLIYIPKTLMAFTFLLLRTIPKINSKKSTTRRENNITRAKFLGMVGTIAGIIPFSTLLYNLNKGRFNYKIHKANVKVNKLPEGLSGLTILQLSDIHLGNFNFRYHQLEDLVERINTLAPDLIVITGDLVNNFASETKGWETIFSKMKANIGKFAVLGNHDYGDYSDWKHAGDKQKNFEEIKTAYLKFGFTLLLNTNITLTKSETPFSLIGVENWGHPPFPKYGDLTLATSGELQSFKVLLTHDPDHWDAEVLNDTNIDLSLSGHTHGMQIGFKFKNKEWSPAKWKYKHWGGLYKNGDQYLYVNRGLGVIGMPFRIGMPPEVTLLRIS